MAFPRFPLARFVIVYDRSRLTSIVHFLLKNFRFIVDNTVVLFLLFFRTRDFFSSLYIFTLSFYI